MSPAYEKEDGWYFKTVEGEEGPFDSQQEAEGAWRTFLFDATKCKTGACED